MAEVGQHGVSVTDAEMRRGSLYESRNTAGHGQGVTDSEKCYVENFRDAARRAQKDFGQCEHGKPILFGRCKECAAERTARARERFARATGAKATAEACGLCGRAVAASETVVIHSIPVGRGRSFVPVCAECGRLGERRDEAQPCYWCDRPVFMLYEVWAARPRRSGVFCCDRCRSKWHNRRHSQVRKQQRQRYLAKTCEVCGEEFTAKRVDAKTCSPACKQKAYRRRGAA
jgi:hypothetical protein